MKSEIPTISISVNKTVLDRVEFIKESYGVNSRSAAFAIAVNEMYERLQNDGFSNIKQIENVIQ
jgi:metal-responsive CopG/Arc/MetJ family transcriptional regulator